MTTILTIYFAIGLLTAVITIGIAFRYRDDPECRLFFQEVRSPPAAIIFILTFTLAWPYILLSR